MSKHPKQPKPCTSCGGRGLHTWTERNGTARGLTCNDCKVTGKEFPILKATTENHA